jgi:aspartate-semialdehyde dehydrogenase
MSARIAITFASGLLAEALLQHLARSGLSPESVVLLDQSEEAGARLAFGDTYLTTLDQYEYDYENLAAVLLLQEDAELESLLEHADCYVISHHTDELSVPVFVSDANDRSVIPSKPCPVKLPTADMAILMSVVRPMQGMADMLSLQVVNMLSAASYGKPAVDELASQTIELLNGRDVNSSVFPLQLAFNMMPVKEIDAKQDHLQLLMGSKSVKVSSQSILVPAFHGVCMSVCIEFSEKVQLKQIKSLFKAIPDIEVRNQPVSPVTHCKEGKKLQVFNLFQPQKDAKRLQFWLISDWVRNGLVKNYLNVTEILLKSYL